MRQLRVWQYRVSRRLGKLITRFAAVVTLGRMPPFVSTCALVLDGERILVVIDPIRREPVLPGGHLKWSETPEGAVVREVREETGLTIHPSELFGAFAGQEWTGEGGVIRIVYQARVVEGELASSPEGEAMWMPVHDLVTSETRDAPLVRHWLERG